ncbi:MAG: radical SAM protein [Desulfuromonadaceae bacterium]|nr:radical SAM protein [Desulfuromonadaceae bacterium]
MGKTCPMSNSKRQTDHPCFGGDHNKAGRIHLPVAPGCNIKCGFCERKFDCLNESRPGVTSRVLTPDEAVQRVELVKWHMDKSRGAKLRVVGIAGPGDPLANPNTFETFSRVREAFPDMTLCLSTNGLLLREKMEQIVELGIHSLTVTINALTPKTGAKVYEWIHYAGSKVRGEEAAELLLLEQFLGLELAVQNGLMVKVNHVYMPGVNDHETLDLAVKVRGLGAQMMNIMPLIPLGRFQEITPPSELEMEMVRNQAELILSQARHCKQCRADAAGLIGQDLDLNQLAKARLA